MPATLRLTREGFGIELRRGRFEISVDGRGIGSLDYGDTVEAPVEPGHHTLRIRADRYSSRDHSFDAADGEVHRHSDDDQPGSQKMPGSGTPAQITPDSHPPAR